MAYKILFTGNTFTEQELKDLKDKGYVVDSERMDLTEDELINKLDGYDGYINGGDEIATKKVIESAGSLKFMAFMGAGYAHYIDVEAAAKKEIPVSYTPRANSYSVAEFATALILSANKQVVSLSNETKKGAWNKNKSWILKGRTLGIIGMGAIGSEVAKIMHAGYGMNIIYVSRTAKVKLDQELKAKQVNLDELLSTSDIVSIHADINDETRGMIKAPELRKMKPSAILVNAARAEIVDGHDLFEALTNNTISISAFDVYYKEPIPSPEEDEYKLLTLPDNKFIITPHTAYNSEDATKEMKRMLVESLTDFFEGRPVRHMAKAKS